MIKRLTNLCLFLIPAIVTYAVVSSVGLPGNHYPSTGSVNVSYRGLP
jgi:hypothetical protein